MKKTLMFLVTVMILLATGVFAEAGVCSIDSSTNGFVVSDFIVSEGVGANCNVSVSENGVLITNSVMSRDGYFYNYSLVGSRPGVIDASVSCVLDSKYFESSCSTEDKNVVGAWLLLVFSGLIVLLITYFFVKYNLRMAFLNFLLWIVNSMILFLSSSFVIKATSNTVFAASANTLFMLIYRLLQVLFFGSVVAFLAYCVVSARGWILSRR